MMVKEIRGGNKRHPLQIDMICVTLHLNVFWRVLLTSIVNTHEYDHAFHPHLDESHV